MKYPQLVSTRAVNAISDWLVSQLEQLGVESPLIYSRLLLSLLHTSVQINDPIEFNNLKETYLTNRKGNKRNPPCDTDTLKKLTAVQCLMETVSSEQEITKIEKLIEELCEKLNEIENNQNKEFKNQEEEDVQSTKFQTTNELDDPRKRYYRAFPALSKEMEDAVWITKRNIKALTWPPTSGNNNCNNNPITSNNNNYNNNNKGNNNNLNTSVNTPNVVNNSLNNTAGVKKKTKRRRNQAMSKGKMINLNNRKNNKNNNNGNLSPTWDTDFEGSWEMGRDLIKEFIMKQNNRNRSTSESGACNIRYSSSYDDGIEMTNFEKKMKSESEIENNGKNNGNNNENDDFYDSSFNINVKNIAKFEDDDLSISSAAATGTLQSQEISVSHNSLNYQNENDNGTLNSARRLYERDVSNDSLNLCSSSEQNDFAQFKAKFNSSVEALWKNNNNNNNAIDSEILPVGIMPSPSPLSSTISAVKHQNFENFWTNYYNHHYDAEKYSTANEPAGRANNTSGEGVDEIDFTELISTNLDFGKPDNKDDNFTSATSGGVFLKNSIWSDNNSNKNFGETGFYAAQPSSHHKIESKIKMDKDDVSTIPPYSFNISKWSECSFETPFVPSSASTTSSSIDSSSTFNKNDLIRENMLKNSYLYNYKQPITPTSSSLSLSNNMSSGVAKNSSPGSTVHQQQSTTVTSLSLPSDILVTERSTAAIPKISLSNHSLNSGFVEYSRVKSVCIQSNNNNSNKSNFHVSQTLKQKQLQQPSSSPQSSLNDDENLLTSDRTHFRPIKQNYADGYEFDITNNIDEIDFERSKSGYLYYESEKYLEYTRYDTFLSDDEPQVFTASSTTAKTTEASSLIANTNKKCKNRKLNEFSLKFRVKQIEKFCQTDSNLIDEGKTVITTKNDENIVKVGNLRNDLVTTENYNSDSESMLLLDNNDYSNSYCTSDDTSTSTTNNNNNNNNCYLKNDEKSVNLEQWSMAEIGKKCKDNNNSAHTLWGMCPACNSTSTKSVPANRLLKDELNVEADEIMSDLKYMQDLYIGSCNNDDDDDSSFRIDSDWEDNDNISVDIGFDYVDDDDTDCDAEMLKECELYETLVIGTLMENNRRNDNNYENNPKEQQQQDDDHIYYDVNKFISDLLNPENAKSLANALGATTTNICNVQEKNYFDHDYDGDEDMNDNNNSANVKNNNINIEKYIGGLWSNNDENIIWKEQQQQHQQQQEIQKQSKNNQDFFTKFRKNSSSSTTAPSSFLEKFGNWKYSNLAEIWKNTTSSSSNNCCSEKDTKQNHYCQCNKTSKLVSQTKEHIDEENSDSDTSKKVIKNFISFNNISQQNLFNKSQQLSASKIATKINPTEKQAIKNDPVKNNIISSLLCSENQKSLAENLFGIQFNSGNKMIGNRIDRKRRHSASSQSYNKIENQNINNDEDYDDDNRNNRIIMNSSDFCDDNIFIGNKIGILMRKQQSNIDNDNDDDDDNTKMKNDNNSATIITCKYWATSASTDIAATKSFFSSPNKGYNNRTHFDGIPTALALNPSSILKQVAVVSRPLTR